MVSPVEQQLHDQHHPVCQRIDPFRGFNIRHFLNGFIDRYIYATGAIQTDLPFDELRQRSRMNEVVRKEYDDPDFSERIRAGVPTIHP